MNEQRAALGRSSVDQQAYTTVKSYGLDPASEAGQAAQSVVRLNSALSDTKQAATGALSGFLTDLAHGKSATEALQSALLKMLDQIINRLSDQLVSSLFAGIGGGSSGGSAGGLLGSLFSGGGWMPSFAEGGHITGPGTGTSDSILAAVGNGEFVMNAKATAKHRALLEALNSGSLPRFASGGLVGSAAMASPALASADGGSGPINMTTNITVGQGSQGAQADAKLAADISRAVENQVRGMMANELRTQMRPGGILRR